jgi:protein tyrosine phosphatase
MHEYVHVSKQHFYPLDSTKSLDFYSVIPFNDANVPRRGSMLQTDQQKLQRHLDKNPGANRYDDVAPFYANRFRDPGDRDFYVNASVLDIDGLHYIASQGPTRHTAADHWRMVWTGQVQTVVMLTDVEENGRPKCFQYWPEKVGSQARYGEYDVKLAQTDTKLATDSGQVLTRRDLLLTKGDERRKIAQFHLEHWPDHGVPDLHCLSQTIELVKARLSLDNPLLVHCSAGIGRTGVFLASLVLDRRIDCAIMPSALEYKAEIAGMISELRDQKNGRIGMVQTEAQREVIGEMLRLRHG